MMTKYQIVYTKLETTMYNIIRTTDTKKENRIRRAFDKMMLNARNEKQRKEERTVLAVHRFENSLSSMVSALDLFVMRRSLSSRFAVWRKQAESAKMESELAVENE